MSKIERNTFPFCALVLVYVMFEGFKLVGIVYFLFAAMPADNITRYLRVTVFNLLLCKSVEVTNVSILYILVFKGLLPKTGYAFSPKLISLLFCVLDCDRQILLNYLIFLLLFCCRDIARNPGPKKAIGISFCHWNLNNISAYTFLRNKSNMWAVWHYLFIWNIFWFYS